MVYTKGSVISLFYVGIGLTIFSVIIILMMFLLTEFKNKVIEKGVGIDVAYINKGLNSYKLFNGAFVLIMMSSGIASIISSFLIRSHPVFFIFSFLIGVILILVSAQFTNMWYEFASRTEFAAIVAELPLMVGVMKNLPTIMLGISAIIAVVTYSKGEDFA
jgi:hypothetical protein